MARGMTPELAPCILRGYDGEVRSEVDPRQPCESRRQRGLTAFSKINRPDQLRPSLGMFRRSRSAEETRHGPRRDRNRLRPEPASAPPAERRGAERDPQGDLAEA